MNFDEDSSIHSILYRPHIQSSLRIDKRFMRRKHQIFQSLTLRKGSNQKMNNQDSLPYLNTRNQSIIKETQKLPDICLYSKPKQKQIIPILNKDKLMKQISKNLNFVNKTISILDADFLSLIKEKTKSLSYESDSYKNQLHMINEIFSECGINLKSKDVLILEGEQSRTKYTIFTHHPKHPQSLCCKFQVIVKHFQFVSFKHFRFGEDRSLDKGLKSIMIIVCLKCGQDIIKILPQSQNKTTIQQKINEFEEQKRLLGFSKMISSGRYKKTLINDESLELMKSRYLSTLNRSKTSLEKMQQISQTIQLKDSRYTKYHRQNKVKSQQVTMQLRQRVGENLKQKLRQKKKFQLIEKRKNNLSQMYLKKETL